MKKYVSVYKNGNLVANQIEWGDTFLKRFLGLMGRKSLTENQGFYLNPCRSVHTFQMHFPIDVLFLSKDGTVVDMEREMKPWRMKMSVKVTESTLELPAKTAAKKGIAVGDRLDFHRQILRKI